jgi:hypothetical protein
MNQPMPMQLASEEVVVSAPLSFHGSAARLWKLTRVENPYLRWGLAVPSAILLIGCAWVLVLAWYVMWGLFLVPYRLIRRGSRKRKREMLMHKEQMAAIQGRNVYAARTASFGQPQALPQANADAPRQVPGQAPQQQLPPAQS